MTTRISAWAGIRKPGGLVLTGAFTPVGNVSDTNPALQPESNTIHNVFATQVTPFNGARFGIPPVPLFDGVFATDTIPLNVPIERNTVSRSAFHAVPSAV